jgi:hypothetical protein
MHRREISIASFRNFQKPAIEYVFSTQVPGNIYTQDFVSNYFHFK